MRHNITLGLLAATAALAAAPAHAGTIAFTGTIANSGPGSVLGAAPCLPTHGLVRVGDGVGGIGVAAGLSNVGAFEPVMQHCNSPPVPGLVPQTRLVTLGQFEWDFGGGDILRGTYDGVVLGRPPVVLNLLATFLVDGGEGRFRHASGTLDADAVIRLGPVLFTDWAFVGTIDTPAPATLALFGLGLSVLAAGRRHIQVRESRS